MANPVSIRVDGLRELSLKMRNLSEKMHRQFSTSATSAAAQVVKKATKANIVKHPSVRTGSLLNAVIVKKVPQSEAQGLASAHYVTFRGKGKKKMNKKGAPIAEAPHAALVEFGTVHMPAEPSLGPGLAQNIQRAIDAMKDRLAKRIAAAAK